MSNTLSNGTFVRPDYRIPYLPKDMSARFFSWVNLHITRESNKTPRMHYQMIDELLTEDQNVQAMVHRGGAKSTVLTNYLPIYVACHGELPNFGVVHNLIIFSATIEQAIDQLKGIRDIWDNSDALHEILTLTKDRRGKVVADKVDHICWTNQDGHVIHIQAKGAGQSMRGTKKNGHRPQLLIFDDILVDAILTSEGERKKLKVWFYSTVANSVDVSHYKKIVVGTPMTDDDLLMEMLRSTTYKSVKFPVANEFPVPVEEIVSSWKDRFTPERIMKQFQEAKEMGAEGDFYREMMLEVVNDEMRIFEERFFKTFEYKDIKKDLAQMNFFTSMDLAVSKKKSADFSVLITIGVNKDGHWFIVKCDVGRFTPTMVIDKLFEHVKMFKPLEVRAEKAALQQVLDDFIDKRMIDTGIYFNTEGLKNNSTTSKEFRINGLQPKMKMGHIHFPTDIDQDSLAELLYEMKGYIRTGPTTAHDDAVDCLANFLDPDFVFTPSPKSGTEISGSGDNFDDIYKTNNDDSYC